MKRSLIPQITLVIMLFVLIYPLVSEAQERYVMLYSWPEGLGFYNPYDLAMDSSENIYVVDTNNHRIQKFNKYGNLLASWGTKGTNDGQFRYPKGIAVDKSGNVYVSDAENNRIQKFSSSGIFLTKWGKADRSPGSNNGEFSYPFGITIDNSGNIYIADAKNSRIQKFNANGDFLLKCELISGGYGKLPYPEKIAIDSSGNIYVNDPDGWNIQKFDSNGTFLKKWGKQGYNDGEFMLPNGVAVDNSGNVYVSDGHPGIPTSSRKDRIQIFDSNGNYLNTWGTYGAGNGQFSVPRGISISPSGEILVADCENNRIQMLDSSGLFMAIWGISGSGDGQFLFPDSVALDASGNVYVADPKNRCIQKLDQNGNFLKKWEAYSSGSGNFFITDALSGIAVDSSGNVYISENHLIKKFSTSGNLLRTWGSLGVGDGQFNNPRGIAVDSSDNVYVVDSWNHRIQKFDPSGNFVMKWGSQGYADGQFTSPISIAIDPTGNFYVADSFRRIQKFNSNGNFLTKWTIEGSFAPTPSPLYIAADASGNVYVSDCWKDRIQKFDSSGNFLVELGSGSDLITRLHYPHGLAVDKSQNVYVADTGNQNIKVYVRSASNNPPTANSKILAVLEDTPIQSTLTGRDPDGDYITFRIVNPPTSGSLTGSPPNLTYTPKLNYFGTDSFTFAVSDGRLESKLATVQINITSVNDPPIADSKTIGTDEDIPIDITLTGSDSENDKLTFRIVDQPKNGLLTGDFPKLTYTPNLEFNGTDSFTFVANDGTVDSAIATVNITVKMIDDPPVANPVTVKVDEDNSVKFTLTGSDPENNPITFSIATQPSNGTLSGAAPNLTYTPKPNFFGTDSFTFTTNDGTFTSPPATFTITVNPVNDPPVANSMSVTTKEDTSVKITLSATDIENDPLTFKIINWPLRGNMQFLSNQQLIYVPKKDENGTDSFTFTAKDATDESAPATVTITIELVNDPPIANPQTIKTPEDTPVKITLTGSDVKNENETLTFKHISNPTNGILEGTEPELTYIPNLNFFGEDSFKFVVSDGSLESNPETIKIIIEPVNDPPTANPQPVTTKKDTAVDIVLTGSDVESDPLSFKIATNPSNGVLTGSPPNLKYDPKPGFFGNDSFTFTVNDGGADSKPAIVTITVNKVNTSPSANSASATTDEDTPVKITLTGFDPEGDPLTFKIVSQPSNGTLDGALSEYVYTPKLNFWGNDSVTFNVSDGEFTSDPATINIFVKPMNDAPIPESQSLETDEDTLVKITLIATDPEGDKPIIFKIVNKPLNGTLSGTPPIVTYTPNANFNGKDSFTFTASDGKLESTPAKVSISVKPINDLPVIVAQSVETNEDTAVKITLAGNDIDGDKLTFKIVDKPSNGSLGGTPPEITYTPKANFNGNDSFTFIANDGSLDSPPGKVSITVKPINDPPVAVVQSVEANEDTAVKITLTGTDIDGDNLTFKIVVQPLNGSLGGTPPEVTYTPKANFNGNDSFTFIANDGSLDSPPGKVSITVKPVNDPPVAVAQSVETNEVTAVKITLTGTDPENDKFTFKIIDKPSNGSLEGTPPELTYKPKYGFGGNDSLTFIANDGAVDSAPTTIKITVSLMANPFDVNRDGIVNILDYAIVSMYFGKKTFPTDHNPDVNRDSKVDDQDIKIIFKNFGKKL